MSAAQTAKGRVLSEPTIVRWPRYLAVLAWVAVFVLILALGLQQIEDVDFWWQCKTGEWISHHGVPDRDVFTFTRLDSPRIESSWLYCLGLYLLVTYAGTAALVVIKAFVLVVTFGLWLAGSRQRLTPAMAAATAVAALAASQRFVMRPEVLSYLFLGLFYVVLERSRPSNARLLWVLPPLTALWANLHSLFPAGPAMVALWLGVQVIEATWERVLARPPDRTRLWRIGTTAAVLIACLAATLLNPYGTALLAVPLNQFAALQSLDPWRVRLGIGLGLGGAGLLLVLAWTVGPRIARRFGEGPLFKAHKVGSVVLGALSVACLGVAVLPAVLGASHSPGAAGAPFPEKSFISELVSPLEAPQHYVAFFYAKVLLVLVAASVALRPRSVGLFRLLLVCGGLYLAGTAVRNLPFFAFAAVPVVAGALNWMPRTMKVRTTSAPPRFVLSGLTALAIVALCVYQVRELWTGRFYIVQGDSRRMGLGVAAHSIPSGVVEFLRTSGVQGPLFNTQRLGSYLLWSDFPVFIDARAVGGIIPEYRAITDSPGVQALEAAVARYDLRALVIDSDSLPLLALVKAQPQWRLVYADPVCALYFRSDTAPGAVPIKFDRDWLTRARETLGPVTEYDRRGLFTRLSSPLPFQRLARLCFLYEHYPEALILFRDAYRAFPARFGDDAALGHAALATGDFVEAVSAFERGLVRSPADSSLRAQEAVALMNAGRLDRAAEEARLALDAAPGSAEASYVLGTIELKRARYDSAEPLLKIAVTKDPSKARYHANLGTLLALRGRADEAVAELEAAFKLDSTDASVAADLAILEAARHHTEEARRWAAMAWSMSPGDPRIRRILDQP